MSFQLGDPGGPHTSTSLSFIYLSYKQLSRFLFFFLSLDFLRRRETHFLEGKEIVFNSEEGERRGGNREEGLKRVGHSTGNGTTRFIDLNQAIFFIVLRVRPSSSQTKERSYTLLLSSWNKLTKNLKQKTANLIIYFNPTLLVGH
jgi:hypothetical protein